MSHCPGPNLEDFLTDWHRIVDEEGEHGTGVRRFYKGQLILNKEQFGKLVEIYEPAREGIERVLADYDEEENGSWRDYSYYAFDPYLTEEISAKAKEYLESIIENLPKTPGIFG